MYTGCAAPDLVQVRVTGSDTNADEVAVTVTVMASDASGTPAAANRKFRLPVDAPAQPAPRFKVYVSPSPWLDGFKTVDAGGVNSSPPPGESAETGKLPAVSVLAGFTTTVAALPGPVAVLHAREMALGDTVNWFAALSMPAGKIAASKKYSTPTQ